MRSLVFNRQDLPADHSRHPPKMLPKSQIFRARYISRSIPRVRLVRKRFYASQVEPLPTKITTLDNKIRVATEATPGHFSAVGVYIDAGSRYEAPQYSGVSHILDRMAFKVGLFLVPLLQVCVKWLYIILFHFKTVNAYEPIADQRYRAPKHVLLLPCQPKSTL
jgi:hypothetical protein